MKNCMITFRSVTPAQRAEETLRRAGFNCTIQRTPKWMEERGCGYCLRLSRHQLSEAVRLLRTGKVPFRKVYSLEEGGQAREISI